MSARLLDGTAAAASIRAGLQPRALAFAARAGRPAGLGIVLVGAHAPSEIYVRNKLKAASDIGCRADLFRLPESATLADVLDAVGRLNADDAFDGILVQDPLPAAMGTGASQAVFDVIDPAKDVDGFTPINVGPAIAGARGAGALHAIRRHRAARPVGYSDPQAVTRSSSAAVTSSVNRWRCCCCTATPRSQFATRGPRTWRRIARDADILVAALGRPAFVTPALRQGRRDSRGHRHFPRVEDRVIVEALFPVGSKRHLIVYERRGSPRSRRRSPLR